MQGFIPPKVALPLAIGLATFALARVARAPAGFDAVIEDNAARMMREGRQIFRFDTFGDEAFWGDGLQLHKAIAGEKHGGVGGGVFHCAGRELGELLGQRAPPLHRIDDAGCRLVARLLRAARLARRLGANARELVLERYTWAKVAERCLEAYSALTAGERAGRPAGR